MAITYSLTIAGEEKTIQPGWSINATANGRSVLNCSVLSIDGSYRPALDADVIFTEFVPIISSSVANPSVITTEIAHGLVTGQNATIVGHSGSTPDVNGLHKVTVISETTFSIEVNVTVAGTGGTAGRRIFGGSIVLPAEAGLAGYGVVPIVTTVDAADYNSIAERRYIRAVITGASPAMPSHGFLDITTNFSDGDTFILGTQTYTMKTVLSDVDGYVLIGSTMNGSLLNLTAAINHIDDQSGVTYAASTAVNADASASVQGNTLKAIANVPGVAGDTIPISASHGYVYGEGGGAISFLQLGAETSGTANKLKAVLSTLVSYLTGDGITLHPDQVEGPDIPELSYDYLLLRDVLEQISVIASGYTWIIDEYKRLRMSYTADEVAPFNVTAGDGKVIGDITVQPTRTDYANRIILRYNNAAIAAWGWFSVHAQFPDEAEVKIGSTTYVFQLVLTDVAGHVLIGGSIEESINNLIAAINLAGGAGVVYADKTTKNASVEAWMQSAPDMMGVRALTPGAAGNSIECTTDWPDAEWYWEGGGGITTLFGGADSFLQNFVISNDASEQAAHGIWETIIESPDTTDEAVAQITADAYLGVRKLVPKTITYSTCELGLIPGQTQTIVAAARGLNGTFLITDVVTEHIQGSFITRTVTAIENLILQSVARWRDTYKQWSGNSGGSSSSGSTVSGGIVIGSSTAIYGFGGSQTEWQQSSGPDWVSANSIQIQIDTAARGSLNGTCYVRLRATSGSVTARLRNVTDGVTVGTSAAVSSTSFVTVFFGVILTSGTKTYEIQLLPSLADVDVQLGSAYLE